jgi:hypothetical protein
MYLKHIDHTFTMLHLAFEKSADTMFKKLVKTVAGPYVHTELVVTQTTPHVVHTGYSAYINTTFSRLFESELVYKDQTHDFLQLTVNEDEMTRISKTCEACVETKKPYNTRDMALTVIPFRNPTEIDIFNTQSLFCSQSIVLILRSCLEETNPLMEQLNSVNSRTITPSQLYKLLHPHCKISYANKVLKASP